MKVVSDTTPINYLVLIDAIELLQALYTTIHLPTGVITEMLDIKAPAAVRAWAMNPPAWVKVEHAAMITGDDSLGIGEREAIGLAEKLDNSMVLLDDARAIKEAEHRGIRVFSTLNILEKAHRCGLIDLRSTLERLQMTSFYLTPDIYKAVLDRNP